MAHVAVIALLFIVALFVTLVMFVVWLLLAVVRFVARLFLGPGLKQPKTISQREPLHTRRCMAVTCKALNPVEARFCRRCGRRMDEPQHVPVRRVAML